MMGLCVRFENDAVVDRGSTQWLTTSSGDDEKFWVGFIAIEIGWAVKRA